METVRGTALPELPIAGLQRVRDLHYYEGPLLTEYVSSAGENYLFYWCDCNEAVNRWMVLRVNEASILRLANRFVPMDYVIPNGCKDSFVYLVDIPIASNTKPSFKDNSNSSVVLVAINEIPDSYKPARGAYLEPVKSPGAARAFSVLVEEAPGWTYRQLTDFPHIFTKVYALLYGANVLRFPVFANYPWRGGFSSLHFFRWLVKRIPSEDRPYVSAMQFASPGFIRFRLHGQTAELVARCVKDCSRDKSEVYTELSAYIRKHKLNDIEDERSSIWLQHDSGLEELGMKLLRTFTAVDTRIFTEKSSRPFETAKISMAFYRYVRDLMLFESDGMIKFPEAS